MTDSHLETIAKKYGTPCYVYSLEKMTQQVETLKQALPNANLLYAVKANPNGAVLTHLATLGLGAEVITLGELERSLHAGFAPEKITLGGPRQDEALIERALEKGVKHVSLDSVSQWHLWKELGAKEVRFILRLNPALDPKTHEHLATGMAKSKFGMTLAETKAVAAELSERGQLDGFHVHAGSQIADATVYHDILKVLEPLYRDFPEAKQLDIGGGFGVPNFDLTHFAERVLEFSKSLDLRLTTEPGRYLVAEAGVLLSRVLHTKTGALHHVIADAGMADLLRPALYGAEHPMRVLGKTGQEHLADIDGPLCENADRLAQNRYLPQVEKGDLLVVEQAGAYGFTMSSNYASSLRPAEVVVERETSRLVRRRETVDDLLRLES